MKLEDQVCSLEQAKKLKELGVLQCSFFYFDHFKHIQATSVVTPKTYYAEREYAAFTVAELGAMLPNTISDRSALLLYQNNLPDTSEGKCCAMVVTNSWEQRPLHREFADTEAQARANLLIHLLQFGEITPEQVNKSIQA